MTAPAFVIGIGDTSGPLHAVEQRHATSPRRYVGTVCGASAVIARKWGEFVRGNEHIDRHGVCPGCSWSVAIATNTLGYELAAITPTGSELDALMRLLPDPLLFLRICQHLVAEAEDGNDDRTVQLLAVATLHRPVVLMPEECCDGSCEHDDEDACHQEATAVACGGCSIRAGSWAGEWEGWNFECVVPAAECAVLPAMAAAYRVDKTPTEAVLALNAADRLGYLAASEEWTDGAQPLPLLYQDAADALLGEGQLSDMFNEFRKDSA